VKTTLINQTENKDFISLRSKITKINSKVTQSLNLPLRFNYSIILVNSETIQIINRDYRKLDKATDVISFAYNDGIKDYKDFSDEIGDIFINLDYVNKQALEYGHTLEREYLFLITHGVLHLLGYDHQNPKDEKIMFDYQKEILHDIAPR
jgi:probable rRNA maturation factor